MIWCGVSTDTYAQGFAKKYINRIFNDTTDPAKRQVLIYPTLAYSPETSWEVGLATLMVYHNNNNLENRLSEIYGFTFFTLEKQYGIWFDHAIYTDADKWFFLGRIRLQSFPLYYHGIGLETPESYLARVDANQILIKERVLREVRKNFYVGLEADFQRMSQVEFIPGAGLNTVPLPRGGEGSTNFGLGAGLVYDNRHNVLNVRDGFFSELALLRYDSKIGSDFNFNTLISDTRWFKPVGKNNVLAIQTLGQFNIGETPFNQLALMGGESIMRGYYLGRFRDQNQVAAQAEFRMLPLPLSFSKRIGAAFFASAGNVFASAESFQLEKTLFAGGGGLRFLIFPKKDIWTRLDLAFTREGTGFYFFIGEAF